MQVYCCLKIEKAKPATGSEISYFGDNDLSLPQFRSGDNDSKNR